MYEKLLKCLDETDDIKLKDCLEDIRHEIFNLKNQREGIFPKMHSKSVLDSISYYVNVLERISLPVFFTFITLILIIISISFVYLLTNQSTVEAKTTLFITFFSAYIFLLILLHTISELLEGKFKNIKWAVVGPMLVSLFLNIVFLGNFYYQISILFLLFGYLLFNPFRKKKQLFSQQEVM